MTFLKSSIRLRELVAESTSTVEHFNPQTLDTETTKLQVHLGVVEIAWNDNGDPIFNITGYLTTESGQGITSRVLKKNISVLDQSNVATSPHDYFRDQVVDAVKALAPYNLPANDWVKNY